MNHDVEHDRFVNKNKNIARAYELEGKDSQMERKGFSHIQRKADASCFNCKYKNKCSLFRSKRSGGNSGVVSFGGEEKMICDRYEPAPTGSKSMSKKQIKSLLKNVKKGYK